MNAEDYKHHLYHLLNEARTRELDKNLLVQSTFPSFVVGYLEALFEGEGIAPRGRWAEGARKEEAPSDNKSGGL